MASASESGTSALLAGRYRVLDRIGSGGMAVVFLAEDSVLGREVAVKRLHSATPPQSAERFRREARLGAYLNHPHIVTVFDTASDEEGILIVMEYVPGTSLSELISDGPLEPERAIEVLRPVASALDHAHAHGVVHRDVKPANVLLREDGVVKLADLGVATAAHVSQITTATDVVGTLTYIAPERLEGGAPGGPSADVYSLAAVAFEALSGQPAQDGKAPLEILRRTAEGPPDLRDVWPPAPPRAAEVLRRGLDADPARRPASAGQLAGELEAALLGADARTRERSGGVADSTAPVPRRSGPAQVPGRAIAAIAAVAAVLVALAIALNVTGGDGAPQGGDPTAESSSGGGGGGANAGGEALPAASSRADPAQGARLNEQGHALIQQGQPADAVPILRRAVGSFPEGTTDLNYAYALYNLGNALRLSGRPEEAIPILEQRLEIPNQTATVQRELEAARQEAQE